MAILPLITVVCDSHHLFVWAIHTSIGLVLCEKAFNAIQIKMRLSKRVSDPFQRLSPGDRRNGLSVRLSAMGSNKILALDFDGVICDSVGESRYMQYPMHAQTVPVDVFRLSVDR